VAGKMNEAVSIAIKGLFHISLSSSLLDHHDNGQTGEHRCPPMFGSSKDNLPFVDMVLTNLHRSSPPGLQPSETLILFPHLATVGNGRFQA